MARLVEEIVTALVARDEARLDRLGDLPRYMAQLYVIRSNDTQSLEALSNANYPHLAELEDQILTDDEAAKLKQALMDYARGSTAAFVPRALWTLGYFFDSSLTGFLRDQLRFHIIRDPEGHAALGQCIVALDTLGEPILPDGSFDAADHAANTAIARRYLFGNER